ncbi:hypothetical protein [Mycobacteroides chelonae]|jgi:uncharacterized protein RhaS with RHS repeats|uniref:hypothetical protein n=1 Tax=Mycobacteroides chelonae TaxID=1774 RepID=UPI002692F09D|nr:hypothetical protein [Mycobacteroides chelonae]MEC4834416.1 hypothetical protein [Mycobacteroides chelonae]MEC4856664.1 hypothetical protein [Mycobacteroides chelonae]MEC4873086.1 hypothetical protein [Mycobacteroides chelonae]MEC4901637.1 hypothetical protein [Mycobacteroides chelonae]
MTTTTTKPRRNHRSAKSAGTRFERTVADYLAATLDDRIDRRVKTGNKDCGDIGGVRRSPCGSRIAIECKDTSKIDLPQWTREAAVEAANDGALVGVVVHKRRGVTDPAQQWVALTLGDLVALLSGQRPSPHVARTGDCAPVVETSNTEAVSA